MAVIEAPCSPSTSGCQQSRHPRRLNHVRFWLQEEHAELRALAQKQLASAQLQREQSEAAVAGVQTAVSSTASPPPN
jgi:hypothetical protein